MRESRVRLSHTELAALARYAFGLVPETPGLPPATEYEDAEGVLVATVVDGGLTIQEITRWRSPDSVRAELADRGWADPAAWVGQPPEDVSGLPDQLLVLLPVAGTAPDSAAISLGAAVWADVAAGRELVVVPVPVTAAAPEREWREGAAALGARPGGARGGPPPPPPPGRAGLFTAPPRAGGAAGARHLGGGLAGGGGPAT